MFSMRGGFLLFLPFPDSSSDAGSLGIMRGDSRFGKIVASLAQSSSEQRAALPPAAGRIPCHRQPGSDSRVPRREDFEPPRNLTLDLGRYTCERQEQAFLRRLVK